MLSERLSGMESDGNSKLHRMVGIVRQYRQAVTFNKLLCPALKGEVQSLGMEIKCFKFLGQKLSAVQRLSHALLSLK